MFREELRVGQIIVLAWYSDVSAIQSHTCLAVGAETRGSLDALCERIAL